MKINVEFNSIKEVDQFVARWAPLYKETDSPYASTEAAIAPVEDYGLDAEVKQAATGENEIKMRHLFDRILSKRYPRHIEKAEDILAEGVELGWKASLLDYMAKKLHEVKQRLEDEANARKEGDKAATEEAIASIKDAEEEELEEDYELDPETEAVRSFDKAIRDRDLALAKDIMAEREANGETMKVLLYMADQTRLLTNKIRGQKAAATRKRNAEKRAAELERGKENAAMVGSRLVEDEPPVNPIEIVEQTDVTETETPLTTEVTLEDAKSEFSKLIQNAAGISAAKTILGEFRVTKFRELIEDQAPEFYAAIKQAQE